MKKKMIGRILACALTASFMIFAAGCGKDADASVEQSSEAVSESAKESEENKAEVAVPSGVYVRTFTDEIGGEEVTGEFSYTFKEDHTGEANLQDVIPFTWDEKNLSFEDGNTYEYVLEGDTLKVNENDVWVEYNRK